METSTSLELELLTQLQAQLSEHEINSQVRDTVNGLAIPTNTPGVYAWVFVSFSCRFFSWDTGAQQHPVHDAVGAARRIAGHVQGLRVVEGDAR